MCGIAGLLGLIGPQNRAVLKRMSDAMTHRGPDAEGFWESDPDAQGWGPMLAHRRLAILDLSPAGAQPMVDAGSGDVVVLNGEIYNYRELRDGLRSRGQPIASSGDTAVLLRALSINGRAATAQFRGMFAFAFWDVRSKELLLARDALGIKPLYLARNPDPRGEWSIAFASEVRALLASGLIASPKLNPAAVSSMVWNGFTVASEVAVEGISSLQPGEQRSYSVTGAELRREQHWIAPAASSPKDVDEEQLADDLRSCVRLHLASDVPLGVFLSGGIDSSAVANLAQRVSARPVATFTLAFEEAARNEGAFARKVAQAIGTQHQELVLRQQFFVDELDRALASLDQPSFDGLNSYFMSRVVREAGFTVALVGSGGDELFGGYTTFRDLPALQHWARRTSMLPMILKEGAARGLAAVMNGPVGGFPPQTRWAKLPSMVRSKDDLLALYQLAYALFLPRFQKALLADGHATVLPNGLPYVLQERLLAETEGRSALEAISMLEQRLFLGERLLRDTDAASMAASIETRLPLVDQVLVERVNRVAGAIRYEPVRRKAMLRRIGLRGLDPGLFERPKSGFELPYDQWMRSRLGDEISSTFNDQHAVAAAGLNPEKVLQLWYAYQSGARGLYWSRIWALYVLVRWSKRHGLSV